MFDGNDGSDRAPADLAVREESTAVRLDARDDFATLLRLVATGDERAFRRLYLATSPRMLGRAMAILMSRDAAEDALQEAFVRIWAHAPQFDAERGPAMAWIMRVLRNAAIDRLRRDRLVARYQVCDQGLPDLPGIADMVDERLDLLVALDRLPVEQRETICHVVVQGWTHEEVALRQGVPTPTAKARAQRGLKRLRAALTDEGTDFDMGKRLKVVA